MGENSSAAVQKRTAGRIFKFIVASILSILFFFLPINGSTPLLLIVSVVKGLLGSQVMYYMFLVTSGLLFITWVLSKVTNIQALKRYHAVDGWLKGILYLIAFVVTLMVLLGVGPEWFMNWDIAMLAVDVAAPCLITFFFASIAVTVVLDSGAVEFVGTLIEPVMRPVFKLPGRAAVDCLASFVSASAVAVLFTGEAYNRKVYTNREAHVVFTCWSVVSLAFFAIMCSCAGIDHLYTPVVIATFIVCLLLSFICVRIPPWTKGYDNRYIDGTEQTEETLKKDRERPEGGRFNAAVQAGYDRCADLTWKNFFRAMKGALGFTQKTCSMICAVATIGLMIAELTPIFTWIGYILVPLLQVLGFGAESGAIASTIWSGVAEVTLPPILINGASEIAAFYVTVVACCQIVFLSESIPAMLETNVPMKVPKLLLVFLIRTILAMIITAPIAHILF